MWFSRFILTSVVLLLFGRAGADETEQMLSLSGLLGTVTVDGSQWQRLDLRPKFGGGGLEAVLDLELFLDDEGRFRNLGWDFSTRRKGLESVLRKIHYVRYGEPNDPKRRIYLRIGSLESVTLGQGMIMRRYRNTMDSPALKKTGLDFELRELGYGRLSIRGVINNFLDLDSGGPVVGGRVTFRPGSGMEIGVTAVVDTDQLSGLPDSVRAGMKEKDYGLFGVDVSYPLLRGPIAHMSIYGGISRTMLSDESGMGLSGPGILLRTGGLTVQAEYRWVEGHFSPGHFDALYEFNRATLSAGRDTIVTREETLENLTLQGVFGNVRLSLGPLLEAEGSYQHLSGKGNDDRRLGGRAYLKPALLRQLPQIEMAEAYYENRRRGSGGVNFFDASPDTRFGYKLGLNPVPKLSIILDVEFSYLPDGAGAFMRRRSFNLQSIISL
ncbi:MAG TPA: hypothetical protein DIU35_18735 [Candidatus Latescibacteria bacterium]|nr:hypothetical protein [Gemmatimonadota bacterium]HCR19519.1 hypothetical protein [Candidatus Latescibacterota bacterium]